MADILTDLLIYIGIGVIMFAIGLVFGLQVLECMYSRRFMVIAQECSDTDSVLPVVDELARET